MTNPCATNERYDFRPPGHAQFDTCRTDVVGLIYGTLLMTKKLICKCEEDSNIRISP